MRGEVLGRALTQLLSLGVSTLRKPDGRKVGENPHHTGVFSQMFLARPHIQYLGHVRVIHQGQCYASDSSFRALANSDATCSVLFSLISAT